MSQQAAKRDLHDYDSPIKSVKGTVPYNGFLWPTEAWWPGHEPEFRNRVRGQWNFGIVALIDGRYAIDGNVSHIEANNDNPYRRDGEADGMTVVFSTRVDAVRTAAARMIRSILRSRYWQGCGVGDQMSRKTMADVINWTRAKVADACQEEPPKPLTLLEPPPPPAPRPEAGLPLFEMKPNKKAEDQQ